MSKSYLVLDIETVLDPELPIAESSEAERLPAAPHHSVVVLGALLFGADLQPRRLGAIGEGKGESGILGDFSQFLEEIYSSFSLDAPSLFRNKKTG